MPSDFASSRTAVNLMRAFAGESQARNRYTFAAQKADKMQCSLISLIFEFTANQEKEHAQIFYDHLKQLSGSNINIDAGYPVGNFDTLEQLLEDSVHNEYEEYESAYPEFAAVAKQEGYNDIAYSFEKIALIEKTHAERFKCFAQLMKDGKLYTGNAQTAWLCLNCGHIHIGAEAPQQCPVCKHAQGYFVPDKYYNFTADNYT